MAWEEPVAAWAEPAAALAATADLDQAWAASAEPAAASAASVASEVPAVASVVLGQLQASVALVPMVGIPLVRRPGALHPSSLPLIVEPA